MVWSAVRASSKGDVGLGKLGFGIVLAVLISTFAGLGQSLHLIEDINPVVLTYFQYALTVIIGVGASLIAWIGGEVLGGQIAQAAERKEGAHLSFQERAKTYNEKMLASWTRSPERKMVRGELTSVPSSTAVQKPVQAVQEPDKKYMTDEVYDWLTWQNGDWATKEEVPSAREIEKAMDVPVSSAQRGRNRWIRERYG